MTKNNLSGECDRVLRVLLNKEVDRTLFVFTPRIRAIKRCTKMIRIISKVLDRVTIVH